MDYRTALAQRRYDDLRELAEQAGYREKFVPENTDMLAVRAVPMHNMTPHEKYLNEAYFHALKSYRSARRIGCANPSAHWNSYYIDIFTRLKRENGVTKFLDCYEFDNEPVLISGHAAPEKWQQFMAKPDDETATMLAIATHREHYPPVSDVDVLLGHSPLWKAVKTPYYTVFGIFGYLAATAEPENFIPLAGFAFFLGLAAYAVNDFEYKAAGKGWFSDRSSALNEDAVKKLLLELDLRA